mgnify:FL=1|jgi:hypothetical protein
MGGDVELNAPETSGLAAADKRRALQKLERYCYRVCLYLLNEEEPASEAAKQALVQLYREDSLWSLNEGSRADYVRKVCSSHALALWRQTLAKTKGLERKAP